MADQGEAAGVMAEGNAPGGGERALHERVRRRRRGGWRHWSWQARPDASLPQDDNSPSDDQTRPKKTFFYVKGYPASTSVQDVIAAFSKHLLVEVAERHAWGMVLVTADEAGLRKLPSLRINGQPVRVIHSGGGGGMQAKRDFPKSKQASKVIDPRAINLAADSFSEQMSAVLGAVRLPVAKVELLYLLYAHVEEALNTIWPECVAVPFGSIKAGLGMINSDADCFVFVPEQFYRADGQLVSKAERALRKYPQYFTEILAISGASTPIVKLFHLPTGFNCDLSFKSPLAVQNSNLIGTIMQVNCALLPCMVLLKYWARVHELTGAGRLSNYALTLMFVFYLQVQTDLLPSVASMQSDPESEIEVAGWNAGFAVPEQLTSELALHDLFAGFFTFYAEFEFEKFGVCPLLGQPLEKAAFGAPAELPAELQRYARRVLQEALPPLKHARPVLVQDPFDLSHNVASAISNKMLNTIREQITFAANAYAEDRENDAKNFLRKILLDGPPLTKWKKPAAPLSVRYSPAGWSLCEEEWCEAMARATTTVLGTMLGLPLSNEWRRNHEDKLLLTWDTAIDKPIWRRKRFNHLYAKMNFNFIETQAKITKEVITIYREEFFIHVSFVLRLKWTKTGPSRASLVLRYLDGDLDAFLELKGFFAKRLRTWVRKVLLIQLEVADLQELFAEAEAMALGPHPCSSDSEESENETAPLDRQQPDNVVD